MKIKRNYIIFLFLNIPLICILFAFILNMIGSYTEIRYLTIQFCLLFYFIFSILIAFHFIIENFNIINRIQNYDRIERIKKITNLIDGKLLPAGIWGSFLLIVGYIFSILSTNIEEYYNELFINHIKELGTTSSALQQLLVFKPVSLIGFDFFSTKYFIMYFFNFVCEYFSILIILNLILFLLLSHKEKIKKPILFITLLLNSFIFLGFTFITPIKNENFMKILLINELKQSTNHEIIVKYPLMKDILDNQDYKVKIQRIDLIVEKEKRGLVSPYFEHSINIIHSDFVFCSLRSYNYATSSMPPISLFNIDSGFIYDDKKLNVKIKIKDYFKNTYDLEINNRNNNQIIADTYMENEGNLIHFKKNNEDTEVLLKCENSLYSVYYKNKKITDEKFDRALNIMDDISDSNKSYQSQRYFYRGMNINSLNPFICDQKKMLNISQDVLLKNFMTIEPFCFRNSPYYENEINNVIIKNGYNKN